LTVDAIDRALASLCGIARMWARKVSGQLSAGLALSATAWPLEARTLATMPSL
jgi:hypothetical protein